MKKTLLVVLMALPVLALGQHTEKYLIKAGKLFDSETGTFKTGMDVLVDGEHIETVKPDKEVTESERGSHKLIDLSNRTVMPGLIDCHTHLLYRELVMPNMDFSSQSLLGQLTMDGDAYRAVYGAARAKAYLEAGITSVQDLGNSGKFADLALKRAIDEGLVPGPHMRCAGQGLSSEGGQISGLIYKHRDIANDEYRIVTGPTDAVQAVRENITQGADVIKIYSENTPNKTALSVEEMKAIVKEAHRYGVRVTAHATDNQAVYDAVIAGVDGIEHGYNVNDTTLDLMAKRKVFLIPTDGDSTIWANYIKIAAPQLSEQELKQGTAHMMQVKTARLQRAIKHGVLIAAGSDDYLDVHMPFSAFSKHTLIGYHQYGVPIPQVLQYATINASRQLNWADKVGILKKGYNADIIAVDSNIDKDINAIMNVHFVMKTGTVYVSKE